MNAKELFKDLIYDKIKPLIVRYDISGNKFSYDAFSHTLVEKIDDQIVNILIDSIIFYAFDSDEVKNEYNKNRLNDVRKAAIAAYNARVPKTNRKNDGLLGELMLDLYLRAALPNVEILYARVLYHDRIPTRDYRKEIKGYDSICFSCNDNDAKIWLGQVKTGELSYCLDGIKKDLNKNILKDYLSSSLLITADINRSKKSLMADIVDCINNIQLNFSNDTAKLYDEMINYFKAKNIKFMMPAMCVYESKNYLDESQYQIAIKNEVKELVKNQFDTFELNNLEDLVTEILFVVIPVKSLSALRDMLLTFREKECKR